MLKRYFVFVFSFASLLSFNFVGASVVINEVQISPTGDRFIELFNQDDTEVNLTDWYIQRKTQTGTSFSSLVSSTNFENKKIKGHEYFLISRSLLNNSDIVVSTMTLTDSNVIQLKNQSGDIVDKLCWGDVTDCGTVVANPTEGKSVARGTGGVVIGTPTPKAANSTSVGASEQQPNEGAQTDTSTGTTTSGSGSSISKTVEGKIITKVAVKSIAFAGLQTSFQASTLGKDGLPLFYGRYYWNFGDGTSQETKVSDGGMVSHTYFYPGEYTVILEYYINSYGEIPDATDTVNLKVTSVEVFISSIGDQKDFYIELSNNTGNDIDISKWILVSGEKRFSFPKNTYIGAKKKTTFSPAVTGFTFSDKNNLKLVNQDWKTIFDYGSTVRPIQVVLPITYSSSKKVAQKENSSSYTITLGEKEEDIEKDTLLNALVARGVQNNTPKTGTYLYIIFFIILISLAGFLVYILRRRKFGTKEGDDFDILDE